MQVNDSGKSVIAIDKATVHKICSGQVIISLSVAVKELIENSLDAGSSVIDIRLKQYGSSVIEVSDNGSGVRVDDLDALALKHHTSKLVNFNHLESVETFGFRGEALSSLCALSDVSIVTKHATDDVGTKLELDNGGKIKERTSCATQVGTTVILKDIFQPLPVRHKELKKNLKTEFNKMLQMLYAYCIICKNVRITCSNQLTNNAKRIVVATHGNDCVVKNLRDVYGSKGVDKLLAFEQCRPDERVLNEFGIKNAPEMSDVRFEGFVSSCQHESGRNQCDRQFYYVNGRPFDAPKFVKVVNEAYHAFNKDRYPLVVLNLVYDRKSVDVNVTPDKRKVFLNEEKMLLAILKVSLYNLFEKNVGVFLANDPEPKKNEKSHNLVVSKSSFKQFLAHSAKTLESNIEQQKTMNNFFPVEKSEKRPRKDTKSNQVRRKREVLVEFDEIVICKKKKMEENDDTEYRNRRKSVTIGFSIEKLQEKVEKITTVESDVNSSRLFTARIDPNDNSSAESELKKQVDKYNFKNMRVVGQFNLGFVVAKLNSDLFIVDQHASDEKFNYEILEKKTELKAQPLIHRQQLDLTAVDENIIVDNAKIFEKNGFKFEIDDSRAVGQRINLTAVPYSENVIFDKSDVEELIYFLNDSPGVLFRPTRVRKMLASRACRKSIMIGTALSRHEMTRLLTHMSELDQPWNCPHGRPTIRHLFSLNRLK